MTADSYKGTNKMRLYIFGFIMLFVQIAYGQTTSTYKYDGNGNVIADSYNGISFIQYDIDNRPIAVYKTNGTKIEYSYDASGERVRKYDGTANTYYVHGADGHTEAVTKDDPAATVFHIDDIGYAQMQGGSYWTRAYYLKDHLGSIKMTVSDIGSVIGYDDYYPFGMIMPGRSSNSGNGAGRYKFTGKERDAETAYDYFGARYYDSWIGRWLAVDPLAEKYPGWSPYNYCANNPIIIIDNDGREIYYSMNASKYEKLFNAIDVAMQTKQGSEFLMDIHRSKEVVVLIEVMDLPQSPGINNRGVHQYLEKINTENKKGFLELGDGKKIHVEGGTYLHQVTIDKKLLELGDVKDIARVLGDELGAHVWIDMKEGNYSGLGTDQKADHKAWRGVESEIEEPPVEGSYEYNFMKELFNEE